MKKLTSRERFARMFEHRDADRVPIIDEPWAGTIARWQHEGMPKETDFVDFFDIDHVAGIGADNSPRYPEKVLEETAEYKIRTTPWGVTLKNWNDTGSTPQFLDFTIVDRASWAKAKKRMTPDRDRINWDRLKKNYPIWREKGHWINASLWFGFDVAHSWVVGTERVLMALAEDPEWCVEIFNHCLDVDLALFQMVWEAGYHFDAIFWCDDMGYKHNQFFSLRTYRELLKPVHRRAIAWPTPTASRRTCTPAATSTPSCRNWWKSASTRSTRWKSRRAWTPLRSRRSSATSSSSTAASTPSCGTSPT